jgi:poly-beta-1,6-N-acetyl-D-glucosamine synthase
MISSIIIVLLVILLLYYFTFLWSVREGLSHTVRPSAHATPFVSVVVAVRNEQQNIEHCLGSVANQTYDRSNYEILVVDDHSTDQTTGIVRRFAQPGGQPATLLYSLSGDGARAYGKPAAISLGVERAKGEIILCTDADCTVEPGWMSSMVGCFQSDVAFVAGPVREEPSTSFLSELQRLEFLGLITTAAGLIGSGRAIICNGANIAYRRDAFHRVSGFGPTATSCDDETLMQRIIQREVGRVVFNSDAEAIVDTYTPSTVIDFLNQRTRWASKRGHYEDRSILVRLIGLFAFFVVLFVAGVGALIDSSLSVPFLLAVIAKMFAELIVLKSGAKQFRQRIKAGHFLVAELFHVPYIVFATLIGQFSPLRWKDRNLEQ